MGMRRRLVGGAAAMSAGAVALLLEVPPAAADDFASATRTIEHTYEGLNGEEVTCRIYANSSLFAQDDPPAWSAHAETRIDGSGCWADLALRVQYTATSGEPVDTQARSWGITVEVFSDRIAGDYVATHNIVFFGCAENCRVNFQTRPK
jgi:hypothetical protein